MATINPPRDSLNSDTARPSPPASSASSSIGSPQIRPVNGEGTGKHANGQSNGNGSHNGFNDVVARKNPHAPAAPPSEPHRQPNTTSTANTSTTSITSAPPSAAPSPSPAEKTSMTKRLTRMFSTKDANRHHDAAINSPQAPAVGGSPAPKPKPDPASSTSTSTSTPATSARPNPPSRDHSSSSTDRPAHPENKPPKPTTTTAPQQTKKPGTGASSLRFIVNPDVQGGHEHHLKSARRQETLSNMLRNVIVGRQKTAEHQAHEGEQQLSLMSTWVDQLKSERDTLATDKRGGPNATATLVEKYGKCQEIVGRGAFGVVRISHKRGENGAGEQLYAVKEFRRRPDEGEKKYSKRLTSEFCISSSLRHPNVIHTLDLLQDSKGDYCEVMEFCAGGDLYTLVLAAGKLEVIEADCFFKQLMRGVEYMHEMGVAHRDLKPENLLLTTHGSLKITDFGNGECFRMAWEADPHMVTGLCGSAPYIAPEEYIDREFDARAVDVWATGVIYMAMRTGRHLWRVAKKAEDEFYERYLEGRRDEAGYGPIESLHRARCRNVIYSILDPNPGRRITASQVLKSEWGREIKLCKAGEEGF